MPKVLTAADIAAAATAIAVDVAALKAVIEVESGGGWFTDVRKAILDLDGPGGFLDGPHLPKILFEAHIFSRETGGRYDRSHPTLSTSAWDRTLYRGGQAEYERLHAAMQLDEPAALKATSWGMFQILGHNHRLCGHATVHGFVAAMKLSEIDHLAAFCAFVVNSGLDDELRAHDWVGFARGYNGPAYAQNDYHRKLAAAHARHAALVSGGINQLRPVLAYLRMGDRGPAVAELQRLLNVRIAPAVEVDGDYGPTTKAAVRWFQAAHGLKVDGAAGSQTFAALQQERKAA